MRDFLDYFSTLFDNGKPLIIRLFSIPFIIFIAIIINDITGYLYYNNTSYKIDSIIKIENFKKENIKNYVIEKNIIEKINNIENEIINRESKTFKILNLFFNYILNNFTLLLSIHFIWVISFLFLLIKGNKDKITNIFLIVFFGIIVWQITFELIYFIINNFFIIEKNITTNIIINVIIIFLLNFFQKK